MTSVPPIGGSALASVMVCTPDPEMPKAMTFAPPAVFASAIASRSEPAPASLVLVTKNVAAHACDATNDAHAIPVHKRYRITALAS